MWKRCTPPGLEHIKQAIQSQNQGAREGPTTALGGVGLGNRRPACRGAGQALATPAGGGWPPALPFRPARRRCGALVLAQRVLGKAEAAFWPALYSPLCASCFLFHQGPAKMVGALARSCRLPQSTAIRCFARSSALKTEAPGPVRPEPPRAAGFRVDPRAPASPARPSSFLSRARPKPAAVWA